MSRLPFLNRILGRASRLGGMEEAREIVSATPSGPFFGVPQTGRSFRIMAIDIQIVRDRKIAETFHMENWLSAHSTALNLTRITS